MRRELICTAQLALQLNSPYAKELICAAANKGNDDAGILGAAPFSCNKSRLGKMIRRSLSGSQKPLHSLVTMVQSVKMTIKDFLDQVPEWNRQASEIWEQLRRGELPMFLLQPKASISHLTI